MSVQRKIGEDEKELLPVIADYIRKNGLQSEEGLAIALLCNTDDKSRAIKEVIKKNPIIEYDDLLQRAIEVNQNGGK